jgi:hypothetical protein
VFSGSLLQAARRREREWPSCSKLLPRLVATNKNTRTPQECFPVPMTVWEACLCARLSVRLLLLCLLVLPHKYQYIAVPRVGWCGCVPKTNDLRTRARWAACEKAMRRRMRFQRIIAFVHTTPHNTTHTHTHTHTHIIMLQKHTHTPAHNQSTNLMIVLPA